MTRARLAFALVCLLVVGCRGAAVPTGQVAKVPHVGYLDDGVLSYPSLEQHPFGQGLRDLGYVEGQNIIIDYRYAENDDRRLQLMAEELVKANVEVLLVNSAALPAALRAGPAMPI